MPFFSLKATIVLYIILMDHCKLTENQTLYNYFQIVVFSSHPESKPLYFSLFLYIYLLGILMNSAIFTAIYFDAHLHTPLYLFLCNLSLIDMFYTTINIPKLLYMILSGNTKVSFKQCFTQMYFSIVVANAEEILLFIMAYDRYVAICNPLQYHSILSRRNCFYLIIGIWVTACLNSLLFPMAASDMCFCHFNTINQFFCDAKAFIKIACSGTEIFYVVLYIESLCFGLCPFLCNLSSYIKIIGVIMRINSKDGRRKAFSTCLSHLSVIIIFYVAALSAYMMPPTNHMDVLEQVFTVIYTSVTPILNPLIYSLQNKEVKNALKRLVGIKLLK